MPATSNPLANVRVASPCGQSWEAMPGDDRCRFCASCGKHVYNLSAMSAAEGEALVREKEGELCVRFYRRRDGTVLSGNCPVGLRSMRRALLWQCGAVSAVFALFPAAGAAMSLSKWRDWSIWDRPPLATWAYRCGVRRPVIMGAMVAPPPPVTPPLKR